MQRARLWVVPKEHGGKLAGWHGTGAVAESFRSWSEDNRQREREREVGEMKPQNPLPATHSYGEAMPPSSHKHFINWG